MRWVLPLSLLMLSTGLLAQEQDDKEEQKPTRRVRVLVQPGEDGVLEVLPHLELLDGDRELQWLNENGLQLRLGAGEHDFSAPGGEGCEGCCQHGQGAMRRLRLGAVPHEIEEDIELHYSEDGNHTLRWAMPHGAHGQPQRHVERRVIIQGAPGMQGPHGAEHQNLWFSDESPQGTWSTPTHGGFAHPPLPHNPHQDVLHFSNGDVLSGTLVGASETHLSFKTPHGTLEVSRDEVQRLDFAQQAAPQLFGGTFVPGHELEGLHENQLRWAMPVDPALPAAPKVWLGIGVAVEDNDGEVTVSISGLMEGGPAAAAGLQDGDQLLRIAGTDIASYQDIIGALADQEPGNTIVVEVQRGEEQLAIKVELAARPSDD